MNPKTLVSEGILLIRWKVGVKTCGTAYISFFNPLLLAFLYLFKAKTLKSTTMKRIPRKWLSALVFVIVLTACQSGNEEPKKKESAEKPAKEEDKKAEAPIKFLNLSDIHFDPFSDPSLVPELVVTDYQDWPKVFEKSANKEFSTYNHDSNYPLLISSLKSMKASIPNPDFIAITGDFLSHNFGRNFESYAPISHSDDASQDFKPLQEFTEKTMRFLNMMVEKEYPGVPVLAALGNNDSDCGDYMVQPSGPFLEMLTEVWKPSLNMKETGSFTTTFPEGGYYTIPAPFNPKLHFVILNSNFLSNNFNRETEFYCTPGNYGPDQAEPGKKMMNWLDGLLTDYAAQGHQAIILQHIPPGINTFNIVESMSEGCAGDSSIFFTEAFNEAYIQMVRKHYKAINCIMAGHYHKDDFRLVMDANDQNALAYLHVLPSISPIYDNNPGFEVVDIDPSSGQLLDYAVHYVPVNDPASTPRSWEPEYTFQATYGEKGLSAENLLKVHEKLETDTDLQKKYLLYYPVSDDSGMSDYIANFKAYWCSINNMSKKEFGECMCGS